MQNFRQWMAAGLMCALWGCAERPYTAESVIRAQQTTAPQNPTTPPQQSAIFTPPVQAPTNATLQDYLGINLEHWIAKLSGGGKIVTLEDGSIWETNPSYWGKTMVWLLAQKIVVSRGVNPGYPYQIANETTKEVVEGRLAGGHGSDVSRWRKMVVAFFMKMGDTEKVVKEEVLANPSRSEKSVRHTRVWQCQHCG